MEISKIKDWLLRLLPYYRWHPEVAIRYLPVVRILEEDRPTNILEVGSGGLSVAPYLKREVTGLDTKFSKPFYPGLIRRLGTAANIPFAKRSFAAVISLDTLEHIPKEKREQAVGEMFRVADRTLILGFPSGQESQRRDESLADYYKGKFAKKFPFFEEHKKFGLPSADEIVKIIKKLSQTNGRPVKVKVIGNENLKLRDFLMRGWMTTNPLVNFFHRKIVLFLIPLLRFWDRPPYYRSIIIVHFN